MKSVLLIPESKKMNSVPIFIINRACETERLRHCRSQLARFFDSSCPIQVVEACEKQDAFDARHSYFSYQAFKNMNSLTSEIILPTWSAAACALSHFTLWKEIGDMVEENIMMIIEDDFMVVDSEQFLFRYNEIVHFFQRYGSDVPMCCLMDGRLTLHSEGITRIYHNTTRTHAYFINPTAARLLTSRILPITYQIDIQLCCFARQNPDFYLYNCEEAGTDQSPLFSSQTKYHHLSLSEITSILPDSIATTIHEFLDISNRPISSPYQYYYYYG